MTIIPWLVIVVVLLVVVDTVFFLLSICVPNPKKSKNISFSLWGREKIQNDMVQPVQTLEHQKFLFQLK